MFSIRSDGIELGNLMEVRILPLSQTVPQGRDVLERQHLAEIADRATPGNRAQLWRGHPHGMLQRVLGSIHNQSIDAAYPKTPHQLAPGSGVFLETLS